MTTKNPFKSLLQPLIKNIKRNKPYSIIILVFLGITAFVVVVAFFKTFAAKQEYVYAKVKVSQGLWWATTLKPPIWFVNAIRKGEVEYNLLGKPVAEVLEVRYYPARLNSQYDIYLTLKLAADYNKKTQKYVFRRGTIAVGSPIELEFPSAQITGTVIEISPRQLQDKYLEKEIALSKRNAYPWESAAIKVGDTYFDGEEVVFEVLDKSAINTSLVDIDPYGNVNVGIQGPAKYVTVRGKIKLKDRKGQLVYGEEQVVKAGSNITLATDNFVFEDFVVQEVK